MKKPESERILEVTREFRNLVAIANANMDYNEFCKRIGLDSSGNYTLMRWQKFQQAITLLSGFSPIVLARLLLPDVKLLGDIPSLEEVIITEESLQ